MILVELFEKGVSRRASPFNDLEAREGSQVVCRAAKSEPSELKQEGDRTPRGDCRARHVRVASYLFTVSELQKLLNLLKLNVLGEKE